ncbi:hypothetical protein WJX73_010898 [Symbiochloris irregularis]|uniref:Uncharacterized protein n=1 Tax=Symbiochloris irregularis TaxID=706552 RepID=A0AAW1PG63_9CHLO
MLAETAQLVAGGSIHVLVNNAGVLEEWKAINDTDPSEWQRTWMVNVRGIFLATKALLPSMLAHKGGTIINISSIGGLLTRTGASAYQMSKTDVTRFTAFLDADHSSQGIRTFALEPGNVSTDLALCMPEDLHHILVDKPELSGAACVYLTTSSDASLVVKQTTCKAAMSLQTGI